MATDLLVPLRRLLSAEGKALTTNPGAYPAASVQVGPNGSPVQTTIGTTNRISQKEARRHLDAYGGGQAIDWVQDCVDQYCEALTSAETYFEDESGDKFLFHKSKTDPPDTQTAPDDLVALMERPNPWQTWSELLTLAVIDYLMVGNVYWLKFNQTLAGRPLALYRLQPTFVTVLPGAGKELIDGYEYRLTGVNTPVTFKADDIVHIKRPNPHNPYLGLGKIAGGVRMLDTELALTDTIASFFENGAKLSGVLTTDRRVPDSVFKKIQTQFRQLYTGSRKAYQVAVLEQGLAFQSITPTAVESQFLLLSEHSGQRICNLFGVPIALLTGETRQGVIQDAQRYFDNKRAKPLAEKLAEEISVKLTEPAWGLNFVIDYKYLLPREDQLKLAANVATLPGVRVNDVLVEAGFDPVPDDEKDPDTGKPLGEKRLNLLDQSPAPNLAGEGGRPPNGVNATSPAGGVRVNAATSGANPGGVQNRHTPGSSGRGGKSLDDTLATLEQALARLDKLPEGKATKWATPASHPAESDPLQGIRQLKIGQYERQQRVATSAVYDSLEAALSGHIAEGKALRKDERGKVTAAVADSGAWKAHATGLHEAFTSAASGALVDAIGAHRAHGYQADDPADPSGDAQEIGEGSAAEEAADRRNGIVEHVAEGVRRGYSSKQLVDGVAKEGYDGLHRHIAAAKAGSAARGAQVANEGWNEGTVQAGASSGHDSFMVQHAGTPSHHHVWSLDRARAGRGAPGRHFTPVKA